MSRAASAAAILFVTGSLAAMQEDGMAHARRGYELQTAGRSAEAEAELRKAIELEPRNPLFHSALSGLLLQAKRSEDAIQELQAALDCKPAPALEQKLSGRLEEMMLARGAELAAAGTFRSGLALSQNAARRFANSAPVFQMLGFFQSKERLNVEAAATYRRALALDPKSVDAEVGLVIAQAAAGMEAEAIRGMESGMSAHPEEARFPQALGSTLLARPDALPADLARARSLLNLALRLNPDLAESHYQLGALDLRAGDSASALQHLQAATRLDPLDGRVHFALAKLFRQQNRPEDAKREMDLFSRSAIAARNE